MRAAQRPIAHTQDAVLTVVVDSYGLDPEQHTAVGCGSVSVQALRQQVHGLLRCRNIYHVEDFLLHQLADVMETYLDVLRGWGQRQAAGHVDGDLRIAVDRYRARHRNSKIVEEVQQVDRLARRLRQGVIVIFQAPCLSETLVIFQAP